MERQLERQLNVPPHSIEAEQGVLGGLLLDNRAWDLVADKVHPEDFTGMITGKSSERFWSWRTGGSPSTS